MKILAILVAADEREARQVAAEAGIAPSTLSDMMKGRHKPSREVVVALAKALGVHPAFLGEDISRKDFIVALRAAVELKEPTDPLTPPAPSGEFTTPKPVPFSRALHRVEKPEADEIKRSWRSVEGHEYEVAAKAPKKRKRKK